MLLKPEEESKTGRRMPAWFLPPTKGAAVEGFCVTPEEEAEHLEFLQNKLKNALWLSEPAGESENQSLIG